MEDAVKQANNFSERLALFFCAVAVTVFASYMLSIEWQRYYSLRDVTLASTTIATFISIAIILIHGSYLSILSVYVLSSYLFLYSSALLFLWNGEDAFYFWFLYRYETFTTDAVYIGKFYIANLFVFSGVAIGVALPVPRMLVLRVSRRFQSRIPDRWYRIVARQLFILFLLAGIGLLAFLSFKGRGLEQFFQHGYSVGYSHYLSGISYVIRFFFFWSLLYLIVSSSNLKSLRRKFIVLLPLALSPLLYGGRSPAAAYAYVLLASFISYSPTRLGVNWRVAFIIAISGSMLIPFVENVRLNPASYYDLNSFSEPSRLIEPQSPLPRKLLTSFMHPSVVGIVILSMVPEDYPYFYGIGYLTAFRAVLPFLPSTVQEWLPWMSSYDPEGWLVERYNPLPGVGLGFLQAYEAYREFGYPGIMITNVLIGIFLSFLWQLFRVSHNNPALRLYCLYIFHSFVFWPRGTAVMFINSLSFGFVVAFLMPLIYFIFVPSGVRKFSPTRTSDHPDSRPLPKRK